MMTLFFCFLWFLGFWFVFRWIFFVITGGMLGQNIDPDEDEETFELGMAEAVCGVQIFQTIFRKRLFQIILADTVNTAPCESLAALIDKNPIYF